MQIDTLQIRPAGQPLVEDHRADVIAHRRRAIHRRIINQYRKSHTLCQMCLAAGHYSVTEEIHHIHPVADGGITADDNLLALCRTCHSRIHEVPYVDQQKLKAYT